MVARGQNRGRRMTGAFMQMFNPVAVKAAICAVAILGVGYWVFVQGSQGVEAHKESGPPRESSRLPKRRKT